MAVWGKGSSTDHLKDRVSKGERSSHDRGRGGRKHLALLVLALRKKNKGGKMATSGSPLGEGKGTPLQKKGGGESN